MKRFTVRQRKLFWNLFITLVIFCILIMMNAPRRMNPFSKEVEGWESHVSRETKTYIVPENDTYIISGRGICKESIDIIIFVFSAPENLAQRSAIRETWASYDLKSASVAFLLGRSKNSSNQLLVEEENAKFQDIIQENFIDSYNNLTVKSVMMLKWFLNKCRSPIFLMKTDDDVFINMKYLSVFISKMNRRSVLTGSLLCKMRPILDPTNKWYTPKYIYQEPFYPNYLSGVAYVMSRDVALKLYATALSTTLILLEDAFITGICAAKAGIEPQNHDGFYHKHFSIVCHAEMIVYHHLNPQELRLIWNQRNNCTSRINPSTLRLKAHRRQCS